MGQTRERAASRTAGRPIPGTQHVVKLTIDGGAVLLPVKVVPGASRTRCMGTLDDRAKIAVAAPPEKGKANDELTACIAKLLNVPRRAVTVVDGLSSPRKTVRIENVTPEAVRIALNLQEDS